MIRHLRSWMVALFSVIALAAFPGCDDPKATPSPPSTTQQVTYKCGCGKTQTVDAAAPAPSC